PNSPDSPAPSGSIISIVMNGGRRLSQVGDYAVTSLPLNPYIGGYYANGLGATLREVPGLDGEHFVLRPFVPAVPVFNATPCVPLAVVGITIAAGGTHFSGAPLTQGGVSLAVKWPQ